LVARAIEDLASLRAYIAEDNPAAARRIVLHLIQNVEQLLPENPQIGRAGRVPGTRELVVAKTPYIVPYRIQRPTIQILRVYHGHVGLTAFDFVGCREPEDGLRQHCIIRDDAPRCLLWPRQTPSIHNASLSSSEKRRRKLFDHKITNHVNSVADNHQPDREPHPYRCRFPRPHCSVLACAAISNREPGPRARTGDVSFAFISWLLAQSRRMAVGERET
jgi:toxin ParE1/3/4